MTNLTIEELEEAVLISQITDSYTRSVIAPTVTSFNKKVTGTDPKMNTAYLLRKRLPGFAAHLESIGIDLDKDLQNNLRIAFSGLGVHLQGVDISTLKYPRLFNHSTSLSHLFLYEYLEDGKSFRLYDKIYIASKNPNNYPLYNLTLNGRTDISRLDIFKFFILLQE